MTITIYSDESCTNVLSSGFVGEYARIEGSQPVIITNQKNRTIDEQTITFYQIQDFIESSTRNYDTPSIFPITPTETKELQTFYFTPNCRYSFYCWGSSHAYYFESAGFETRFTESGNFEGVTPLSTTSSGTYYDIAGFMFRTGTNAHYDGNTIYGGFFGLDLISIDNQGRQSARRCIHAVAPWDRVDLPGEFKPYKPKTGNSRRGNNGTGYYPNSTIPALPTGAINSAFASVLGTGNGLTYYKLTGNSLQEITEFLYDCTLTLKFRNSQYREAIASMIFIPYNVTADSTNTLGLVYLANKSIPVSGSCDFVTTPLKEIDFGFVDLTAENIGFRNFADYIHTTASLFLPCFGNINIPMSTLASGRLYVRGVIDVRNGNILYRVETQGIDDETPVLFGHYNSNCGLPVPVGGANAQMSILGAISSIGTVGVGVATGNPLNIVGGISSLASQTAPDVDTSGAVQPACAAMGTPVPILQIRKRVLLSPPKYGEINGIPSAGNNDETKYTVGDFTGFLKCAWVDVSGISGATDDEKAEIESLLESGVYL